MKTQTFPTMYAPEDVSKLYIPRTQAFIDAGIAARLKPASQDGTRGALILIDMQNDFVRPDGALAVPNAEGGAQRLIEFIYTQAEKITAIYATLDTHYPFQIFFSEWWESPADGSHPAPYTVITQDDILAGKWRARVDPVWSHKYIAELARSAGKKQLMIWPKHTMLGTPGHNLTTALYEAIMWHSAARNTQPHFLTKGDLPQVERYGAFAPEVEYPGDVRGQTDVGVLELLGKYNRTWWAGEAMTHCLIETQKQAVGYFAKAQRSDVLKTMHFLQDCTSPILHPDIDFKGMALAELATMEAQGVQLVKSTDPIK